MSRKPPAPVPPSILSEILGEAATAPIVTRRVVYHSIECGAHSYCEGECRRQPKEIPPCP